MRGGWRWRRGWRVLWGVVLGACLWPGAGRAAEGEPAERRLRYRVERRSPEDPRLTVRALPLSLQASKSGSTFGSEVFVEKGLSRFLWLDGGGRAHFDFHTGAFRFCDLGVGLSLTTHTLKRRKVEIELVQEGLERAADRKWIAVDRLPVPDIDRRVRRGARIGAELRPYDRLLEAGPGLTLSLGYTQTSLEDFWILPKGYLPRGQAWMGRLGLDGLVCVAGCEYERFGVRVSAAAQQIRRPWLALAVSGGAYPGSDRLFASVSLGLGFAMKPADSR